MKKESLCHDSILRWRNDMHCGETSCPPSLVAFCEPLMLLYSPWQASPEPQFLVAKLYYDLFQLPQRGRLWYRQERWIPMGQTDVGDSPSWKERWSLVHLVLPKTAHLTALQNTCLLANLSLYPQSYSALVFFDTVFWFFFYLWVCLLCLLWRLPNSVRTLSILNWQSRILSKFC